MVQHLVVFPLVVLKDILPAGLFLVLAFIKPHHLKAVWRKDVLQFIVIIFLANVAIYWISPGTRSRYTYMLLPLPTIFLMALYLQAGTEVRWLSKALWWIGRSVGALLILGGLALLAPQLQPHWATLGWGVAVATVLAAAVFLWQFWRPQSMLMTLALSLVVTRIWFDAYIIPMRDTTQIAGQTRRDGIEIGQRTQGKPLYLWLEQHDGSVSLATVFYAERERRQTLGMTNDRHCGAYYIGHTRDTVGLNVTSYYQWDYKVDHYVLFTFPNCDTIPASITHE
jgi:4-amino-4-deoxy-L-arabinose transferase-like glycosyltransferase